ncbi:MAG: response regulator transcription factor [Chitinophagaceae bacterium]|nr:response regulator transcription factor [Chitinophagaceae bacterium]
MGLADNEIIKIAIAEDHTLFRQAISIQINTWDSYKVILEAANGRELLDNIRPRRQPDIVLLDLNMPVMDGYETLKALKNDFPDIKVIVLTGYHSEELILQIIRLGARGYLNKNEETPSIKKSHRRNAAYRLLFQRPYGCTAYEKSAAKQIA